MVATQEDINDNSLWVRSTPDQDRALDRELQNRFILTLTLLAKNQSSITKPAFHKFSEAAVEQTVILSWTQHSQTMCSLVTTPSNCSVLI